MGIADSMKPVSLVKILKAAAKAQPTLTRVIQGVVARV
jgi:hypothetical protein